jgi:hypothetical protein
MHKLIPARSRDAPIPKKLTRHPIATRLEQIYRERAPKPRIRG